GTTAYAPIENNFRLFTSDGLAKRLRVSQATVIRAVKRGLITPSVVTPGGHYRFSPNDVAQAASALGQMGSREPVAMGSAAPALQPEPQAAVDPVTVAEPAPTAPSAESSPQAVVTAPELEHSPPDVLFPHR